MNDLDTVREQIEAALISACHALSENERDLNALNIIVGLTPALDTLDASREALRVA